MLLAHLTVDMFDSAREYDILSAVYSIVLRSEMLPALLRWCWFAGVSSIRREQQQPISRELSQRQCVSETSTSLCFFTTLNSRFFQSEAFALISCILKHDNFMPREDDTGTRLSLATEHQFSCAYDALDT